MPCDLTLARARFGNVEIAAKPVISASARGIVRIAPDAGFPDALTGRRMLLQPMQPLIMSEGEYSLFWFAGRYSHAFIKHPGVGDFRVQPQYGGRDMPITPPASAIRTAQAALALIESPLLYARIDLVGDGHGGHAMMEIELIEPQLFLDHAPDRGRPFAESVRMLVT